MNVYFLLREDLEYTSSDIFDIALRGTQKLDFIIEDYKVLMIYNEYFLSKMEERFIADGIAFEWIDIKSQNGLVIYTEKDIQELSLIDCVELKQFAYYRNLKIEKDVEDE
jgi:hypothetical protein